MRTFSTDYLYTRNTHVSYKYNGSEVVSCPVIPLSLLEQTYIRGDITVNTIIPDCWLVLHSKSNQG